MHDQAVPSTYDILTPEGQRTEIRVEWRDPRWAVTRGREVLSAGGEWDWEPLPSSRTGTWKKRHRFPLDEAIERAIEAVEKGIQDGTCRIRT